MGTTTDRPVAGQGYNSGNGWGGSLQLEKKNPSAGNNSVPFFAITAFNAAAQAYTGGISFNRSNSNTQGTQGAVTTSQQLGNIAFNGSDGTNFIQGAEIFAIPEQTFATNDGPTALVFATVPDGTGTTTPVERLRIKADGSVDLNASAAKIGNSAGSTASTYLFAKDLRITNEDITATHAIIDTNGIHLDTTSPTAANGLNDYEEGSWTPVVNKSGDAGSVSSYNTQVGRYVRVGKLLWISFYIYKASGSFGSLSNQWYISGIPFGLEHSAAGAYQSIPVGYFHMNGSAINMTTANSRWQSNSTNGNTTITMYGSGSQTNWTSGQLEMSGTGVLEID